MVLDSKIAAVRYYYGLWTFDDWSTIEPADVLLIDGVGPATLDHIRIYLANHNRSLKNDRTPQYWRDNLESVRIAQQMTDNQDESIVCPFQIVIDSAEQLPFAFNGIRADSDKQYRPLIVTTVWRSLGRHPHQLGDYSIDGYIGKCHVERKSIEDLQGTLLDFRPGGNRERFQQELINLASIEASVIIVEGSLGDVLRHRNERRKSEHKIIAKQLMRTIIGMYQDYHVPWIFCESRRMAEIVTFRFFERYWKKRKAADKEAEGLTQDI